MKTIDDLKKRLAELKALRVRFVYWLVSMDDDEDPAHEQLVSLQTEITAFEAVIAAGSPDSSDDDMPPWGPPPSG